MKLRNNIATSAEGFIFNPSTGDSFTTNTVGAEIIELLKTDCTQSKIVEKICLKFEIEPILFERDLEDFLNQLIHYRILEN